MPSRPSSSITHHRSPISMPIREKYHSFSDLFEAEIDSSLGLSRRSSGSSSTSGSSASTTSSFVALGNGIVLNSSQLKQPTTRSSSFSSIHTSTTSSSSASSSGSILKKTASSLLPKGLNIKFKEPSSKMFRKASTLPVNFVIVNGSEGSSRHDIWLNGEDSEDEGLSLRKVEGRGGRHYS